MYLSLATFGCRSGLRVANLFSVQFSLTRGTYVPPITVFGVGLSAVSTVVSPPLFFPGVAPRAKHARCLLSVVVGLAQHAPESVRRRTAAGARSCTIRCAPELRAVLQAHADSSHGQRRARASCGSLW